MAEFYLYTDESGKLESNQSMTAFCGYLAHTTAWDYINQEWRNRRMAWGIPAIHMAEINYPELKKNSEWLKKKIEWDVTWESRREHMLDEFATIVHQTNMASIGNVVDADHFRKLPDSPFKQAMRNPLYLSLYHTVIDTIDRLDRVAGSQFSLSIVFDEDEEYAMKCYELLSGLKKAFPEKIGKRIDGICFGNDKAYPGIQAADMIAYESRSLMIAKKADHKSPPSNLFKLLTRDGLNMPTLYTPEELDELQAKWKPKP
jgi:hypothetical protein